MLSSNICFNYNDAYMLWKINLKKKTLCGYVGPRGTGKLQRPQTLFVKVVHGQQGLFKER